MNMAAPVDIIDVKVLNNPAAFKTNFQFLVTFTSDLKLDELKWTLVYVIDAEDENKDQTLSEVIVGGVGIGRNKFLLDGKPPDHNTIKIDDLFDVTVVYFKCEFNECEFIRVGYYLRNYYEIGYEHEGPNVNIDKVKRRINDTPRVSRFPICWDTSNTELPVSVSSSELEPVEVSENSDSSMETEESNEEYSNINALLESLNENTGRYPHLSSVPNPVSPMPPVWGTV